MRIAVEDLKIDLIKGSSSNRTAAVVRGSAWIIFGYICTQVLRTGATLIIARNFIGPELFGVVGLVAVFVSGLSMFSEVGVVTSIVQHDRGDDPDFLGTAFSIQAARGLAIWIAAILAAYPLAQFYNQPELLPLLAIAGISELLRGLTSTSVWTQNRHLKLQNLTLLTIGSEAVGSATSVLWALASPSAWALVARTIASAAVMSIGSHLMYARAVRFRWDPSAVRDIIHFGGWISLATAMHFLGSQGERLILGKFVTVQELGCFTLALMICTVPARGLSQLANQVYLPVIAKTVRSDRASTLRDFLRARRLFCAVGLMAAIGFLAFGRQFITILLNPRYDAAGWMLQLLGLRVALEVFSAPVSNLMLACGESKYSAAGNVTRVALMFSGVWFALTRYGSREAIIALVIAQAISYFPLIIGLKTVLPGAAGTELRWYGGLLAALTLATLAQWSGLPPTVLAFRP